MMRPNRRSNWSRTMRINGNVQVGAKGTTPHVKKRVPRECSF